MQRLIAIAVEILYEASILVLTIMLQVQQFALSAKSAYAQLVWFPLKKVAM